MPLSFDTAFGSGHCSSVQREEEQPDGDGLLALRQVEFDTAFFKRLQLELDAKSGLLISDDE